MRSNSKSWDLLSRAARVKTPVQLQPYFDLKVLLKSNATDAKAEFKKKFSSFYRLNSAGLTDAFRDRYFNHLFAARPLGKIDPYSSILLDLYNLPRRKGDKSLQCSFVSKLVAIHDESRPIYDKYVRQFFGLGPPSIGSVEFRVAGFITNMERIREQYEDWAHSPRFARTVEPLLKQHPNLRDCHAHRAIDVLVWTVGARRLI